MTLGADRDPPKLNGVLETVLYVDDLDRATAFYEDVLGLATLAKDSRFRAYDVAGRSVLLLFKRGATLETVSCPAEPFRPMTGTDPCTSPSRFQPKTSRPGSGALGSTGSRSKGGPDGRGAPRASISGTRTGICSSLPHRGCGLPIRHKELDVRLPHAYI